jgi:hypothetical protein
MTALDRFSQGIADPAEAFVVADCVGCGAEIYEGNVCFVYDGALFCSWECARDTADGGRVIVETVATRPGRSHGD